MHLGLQWVVSAFGGTSPTKEEKKEDKRASLLSPDERILRDKIVRDLFDTCSKTRVEHPTNPQSNATPQYAIIFRESQSWKDVEFLLDGVIDQDYKIVIWKEKWLQLIGDLRSAQTRVHNAAKLILKLQEEGESNVQGQIGTYKSTMNAGKMRIVKLLQQAKQELQADVKYPFLKQNVLAARVLRFLTDYWVHLTVFSEWHEVPMDEKRLFVQIREPKDPNTNLALFVNLSTKGIFTVEELDADMKERQYSSEEEPYKLKRTKEIGMKRHCIGPKSPAQSRRTSSVKLTAEAFYDFQYVDDAPQEHNMKPTKSSIGDRLHLIVNLALDQVNSLLALKDGQENLELPSSHSVGPRLDLTFLISRFIGAPK